MSGLRGLIGAVAVFALLYVPALWAGAFVAQVAS